MKVRAKTAGFFDICRDKHPREIKAGTVFDVPDDTKLGRWLEKVEAIEPAKAETKPPAKPPAGTPAKPGAPATTPI